MPLSNSLPLLQMYKHTHIQTFKLGSGEHEADGQLTYSNLPAGQSSVHVLGIFTAKGSTPHTCSADYVHREGLRKAHMLHI